MSTREAVITEARRWIGTPYHHAANVHGVGVDCGMLLVEVYARCGLIERFDPRPYSREFHLHRSDEFFDKFCADRGRETRTPGPGDIALWKVGRVFSHGSIVTQWPTIIHALVQEGHVQEEDFTRGRLAQEPRKFFTFWGDAS